MQPWTVGYCKEFIEALTRAEAALRKARDICITAADAFEDRVAYIGWLPIGCFGCCQYGLGNCRFGQADESKAGSWRQLSTIPIVGIANAAIWVVAVATVLPSPRPESKADS